MLSPMPLDLNPGCATALKKEEMKGGTVQINWHGTKPVLTLDFHPVSGVLATGGADFDIKVSVSLSAPPQFSFSINYWAGVGSNHLKFARLVVPNDLANRLRTSGGKSSDSIISNESFLSQFCSECSSVLPFWYGLVSGEQQPGVVVQWWSDEVLGEGWLSIVVVDECGGAKIEIRQLLASGADGGELILWKSHATDASQTWKVQKTLSYAPFWIKFLYNVHGDSGFPVMWLVP
ncbi:hypothetical protein Cgig2_025877 [Carnegiea gigantea]|uniref:Uncharacterized protein n=1 Tax=Carnegiea gigantea TaxID=171969 RepID=A0A9Q1JJ34_9CARY|nr:hypothetical protein Cgig2_025877 [Carnegiea gigantea]